MSKSILDEADDLRKKWKEEGRFVETGNGALPIDKECYVKAVEELALQQIVVMKLYRKLFPTVQLNLYSYLHTQIDLDQLCEDVEKRMKELTSDNPDLLGPIV